MAERETGIGFDSLTPKSINFTSLLVGEVVSLAGFLGDVIWSIP